MAAGRARPEGPELAEERAAQRAAGPAEREQLAVEREQLAVERAAEREGQVLVPEEARATAEAISRRRSTS